MRTPLNMLSKSYFNLTLRNKFIIPAIAVILISFLSVGFYFIHDQRTKQEIRLKEKAERISYLLLSSNLQSIWDVDIKTLERSCRAFFEDEELTRLTIIDTFYGRDVLINFSKNITGTQDIVKKADFVKGNRKIAELEVVFSNYFIEQNLAQLRNTLVLLSALLFLLMITLIRVVSQIALRPLKGLMAGVEHLTAGDLTFRIPLQSEDELGRLAVSFNTMADELGMYHNHLQELVERQTIELKTANIILQNEIQERKRAEEQIKSSLQEKEVLLQEIHHRVKNNMAVIISLLKLQASSIPDERLRAAFKETQDRVQSMVMIHENLYRSDNFSEIPLKTYTFQVANQLIHSMQGEHGHVSLKMKVQDISLSIEQAIPFGLVLNELITNALKHGFPQGRTGEVTISLGINSKQELELMVHDNGVGIPENFDLKNPDSAGLTIISLLVENQLDGSWGVDKKDGTRFVICFPFNNV